MALGKPDGDLTGDDLARVNEIYIVGDAAQADAQSFFEALSAWQAGPGDRGAGVGEISDLAGFVNLRALYIAGGRYGDLAALGGCPELAHLEIYNNDRLTDISGLSGLKALSYVGLITCGGVSDIAPLEGHPLLRDVDLTGTRAAVDLGPLRNMGEFYSLSLGYKGDAYTYLGGLRVGCLRLFGGQMETAEPLETVTGVWKLDLNRSALKSLRGIEAHQMLQYLDISYTAVTDLTPLLELSNLTELVLSEDMRPFAQVLSQMSDLTVRYA